MSSSSVNVRVAVPEVVRPGVDTVAVRRIGAAFETASERLGVSAWRLGGSAADMSGQLGWCGPASSAYLGACAEQRAWLVNAFDALDQVGSTCRAYAESIEQADSVAQQAASRARALRADLDQLVEQVRRVDAELTSQSTRGPGALALFSSEGASSAAVQRLQGWADRLAEGAGAVRDEAAHVEEVCQRADGVASAEFARITAMTLAGRQVAASAALAPTRSVAGAPVEDGSIGSRVGGFFSALDDDVAQPLAMLGGLVGLSGNAGDNWVSIGDALGHAVTHPVDFGRTLVDWDDLSRGDWGHWVGTVGPGALGTVLSAGGYAALKAVGGAQMLERAQALSARISTLVEFADGTKLTRLIGDGGEVGSSVLDRPGLLEHEIAGGHTLEKHVGLTIEQLRQRLERDRRFTASTFIDRASAEHIVAEVLDARAADIMDWLGPDNIGTSKEISLTMDLGRPAGISVKLGREPVVATKVKLVLRRDGSALGFHVTTAYPLR